MTGKGRATLTFSERVAYQYAIEDVYWRHRIWPKDNPGPKPSLATLITPPDIERKVSDYLSKSQVLSTSGRGAITSGELQAEMDRMAQHTGQPEVLLELFQALGNDAFVIAECLARPILAERLASEPPTNTGGDKLMPGAEALRIGISPPASSSKWPAYGMPGILAPHIGSDNTWAATATSNAADARSAHTAVWTGSEMIVWGGSDLTVGSYNTGGRYNPATDSWSATSLLDVPTPRGLHTAVWTGSEMIVWGGGGNGLKNTGGRYSPTTDRWTATSTLDVPLARNYHSAIWSGSEMIVWGGSGCGGNCILNSGGRYNPETDSWTATSTASAPGARFTQTAVWTGGEMIVWGGSDGAVYLQTGGKYNPATNNWTPTSLVSAPAGRTAHTAVWTDSEMIVWGGVDNALHQLSTGGRYNAATNSWRATNISGAPSPRDSPGAVWTGREMIIWGGNSGAAGSNTGGRYDPATDSWVPTATANAPVPRGDHTAIWTGDQMVVWGGLNSPGYEVNTGGRYSAQPVTPVVQSAVSGKTHGHAGSLGVNLPLSGPPAIECRSGGATGDYTLVVTFLANVSVSGTPQATVTSGSATIGSGGVSNGGVVNTSSNVVTIPLTNVANAQTINVTLNNVNGVANVTIPMGVLIGDVDGNGVVNAADAVQTRNRSGQVTDGTNFRYDVDANGFINSGDAVIVRSFSGTALP